MTKDNQKKGNGFFSLKFCFLFLMFLFLFVIPINAETFGYGDSGKKFGYDTNLPSTGGGNTTVYNNNSYYNITGNSSEPLWNANFTAVVWNSSGLIKDWSWVLNSTGLIKDWTYLISGLLSQSTADTLYYPKYNNIANYYNSSNFNITSFYNFSNPSNFYNSSNFNISTFYNSSNPFNFWNDSKIYNGTICLLNGTGCPASSGITNGSSAWLQNLSVAGDFLVDNGLIFANATSNLVNISADFIVDNGVLFANNTSNFVGINVLNPQSNLDINNTLQIDFPTFNFGNGKSLLSPSITANISGYQRVQIGQLTGHNITLWELRRNGLGVMSIELNDSANSNYKGVIFSNIPNINASNGGIFASPYSPSAMVNIYSNASASNGGALNVQNVGTTNDAVLAIFQDGYVGINTTNAPSSTLNVFGTTNLTSSQNGQSPLIVQDTFGTSVINGILLKVIGMVNTSGVVGSSAGLNNISMTNLSMLNIIQSYGAKPLPPYGNSTCVSVQYTYASGACARNTSGIYCCGGSITPDNWTRIAI